MNRDMLRRRLERIGHSVAIAETGAQALAFLRGGKPDLILLDIVLPDASGVDIVRTLRKDLSRSELPVIMVTAKDQREDVIGALDAGANDYLTKPIDFPVALARIRCNLALARLGAQLRQRTLEAERLARQVGLLTGGL